MPWCEGKAQALLLKYFANHRDCSRLCPGRLEEADTLSVESREKGQMARRKRCLGQALFMVLVLVTGDKCLI